MQIKVKKASHQSSKSLSCVRFDATRSLGDIITLAQQLTWLTACFRLSSTETLSYSETTMELLNPNIFAIRTDPLTPCLTTGVTCWHSMFNRCVIAGGFPVPERGDRRGVELSFALMAPLGRIWYPKEYLDGVVLKGFSTILVPTSINQHGVQWHFIGHEDRRKEISMAAVQEHCEIVVEHVPIQELAQKRAFIGYCPEVQVHLGTRDSGFERIEAPPRPLAQDAGTELLFSREVTPVLSVPGMGILGGYMGTKVQLPNSKLSELKQDDAFLDDQIFNARRSASILYDVGMKTGWLVPELSVILHLVHFWTSQRPDQRKLVDMLPFAEPSPDGAEASYQAILASKDDPLQSSQNRSTVIYVGDRVRWMYLALQSRKEMLIKRQSETTKPPNLGRKSVLYGWNFKEIANRQEFLTRLKVSIDTESSGRWETLAREDPKIVVLFCHKLGEPIRPVRPEQLCSSWHPIPYGRSYLVASVKTMLALTESCRGSQDRPMLSPKHYWNRRELLFEKCSLDPGTTCKRLQELVKEPPKFSIDLETMGWKGAVIFGGSLLSKRKGCQPIIAEPAIDKTEVDCDMDDDGSNQAYGEEDEDFVDPEGIPASSIAPGRYPSEYFSPTSQEEANPFSHASHLHIPSVNCQRTVTVAVDQFLPEPQRTAHRSLRRRPAVDALKPSDSRDRDSRVCRGLESCTHRRSRAIGIGSTRPPARRTEIWSRNL